MHDATQALPGSLFYMRLAEQQRWKQVPTLSALLESIGRSDYEICVVEVTNDSTPTGLLFDRWSNILFSTPGGARSDQDEYAPVHIPWIHSISDTNIASLSSMARGRLLLVRVRALGVLAGAAWPSGGDSSLEAAVWDVLNVRCKAMSMAAIPNAISGAFEDLVTSLASSELRELTERALQIARNDDVEAAAEHLEHLWSIRMRQRETETTYRQTGSLGAKLIELLERTTQEVDSLTTLLMTQQLLRQTQTAQTDAERREIENRREHRDAKVITTLAAVFLAPTLVLGYFGVSNSPESVAGIRQDSFTGQAGILIVAAVSATMLYFYIRWALRKDDK